MGYFSSGSEGMDYELQFCAKCAHSREDEMCPVWEVHLLFNYEECNNTTILDTLIPRSPNGLSNGECRMFLAKVPVLKGATRC